MSWIGSLLSALGSAGRTALDEADLMSRGFTEETFNPEQRIAFDRDPGTPMGRTAEMLDRFNSMLDAPGRALDRASLSLTGDELFSTRPEMRRQMNIAGPEDESRGNYGNAQRPEPSDAVGELAKLKAITEDELSNDQPVGRAEQLNAMNVARMRQEQSEPDMRVAQRLAMLREASSPGTQSFAAIGNQVEGDMPLGQQGSFSKMQRPVVEQEQVRVLGSLGMPRQAAEALIDQASSQDARRVIAELTGRKMRSRDEMAAEAIQKYQEGVAKADNPQDVLHSLVIQLRNIGYSDVEIRQLIGGV